MKRETKEFITPSGAKIELKTYLSGREVVAVVKDKGTKSDLEIAQELTKAAVISLNGVVEGAYEAILDLPNADYQALSAEVKEIAGGNFQKAK